MKLYEKVLKDIKSNKQKRLSGDIIALPWVRLPRLSKVIPGITKENYSIISANQKTGKSQIADFLYVFQPIDYLFENRNSNIDVEIIYFSLEMSADAKIRQAISYRLFTKHGIDISPQNLQSKFNDYILDDEIEALIDAESEWLDFFNSKVTYYTQVRHPFGIHSIVKERMESCGHYIYKDVPWNPNPVRDYYVADNPDKIFIIMTDHLKLLKPEKDDAGSIYKAIGRYSSEYSLEWRDLYKCQVVNIIQQTPTSEQQQYTMIGGTILDKVKPTPDGAGENKSVSQDANTFITLFNPAKFNQKEYGVVDLKQMGDGYRELFIHANRDGINNVGLDLYFNGACNYFEELPLTKEGMDKFYRKLELYRSRRHG